MKNFRIKINKLKKRLVCIMALLISLTGCASSHSNEAENTTLASENPDALSQSIEPTTAEKSLVDMIQADGQYKDGEYEASAVGYAGGLKVKVTILSGKITNVEVLSHNEVGEQYYKPAIEDVPKVIVERQSVEGIDAVSGSSMTTKGIVKAVKKALKKAEK